MNGPGPLIANIRSFALDDGPGIRTTVFFKGCPLACVWCHNPECIRRGNEIWFRGALCIQCGNCARACTAGAIRMDTPERVVREACTACGDCVAACPSTALSLAGTAYPLEALLERILRDRIFFETSGGGVTLSGGEPMLYMEYAGRLLRELKLSGIHTAIQTCGLFRLSDFIERVLPYTDLIFYDLKLFDDGEHIKYTGASNSAILGNFRRLSVLASEKLVPRVPLIPGITDTRANLEAIAALLDGLGVRNCQVLEYNPGCIAKRLAFSFPVCGAGFSLRGTSVPLSQSRAEVSPGARLERSCLCKSISTTR